MATFRHTPIPISRFRGLLGGGNANPTPEEIADQMKAFKNWDIGTGAAIILKLDDVTKDLRVEAFLLHDIELVDLRNHLSSKNVRFVILRQNTDIPGFAHTTYLCLTGAGDDEGAKEKYWDPLSKLVSAWKVDRIWQLEEISDLNQMYLDKLRIGKKVPGLTYFV